MRPSSEDDHFISFPNVWTLSQKLPWKGEKEKTLLDEMFFILCKTLGMYSLEVQLVKSLSAMQESRTRSLGGEDPLEKEMTTHFSILAWRIPRAEEPGGLHTAHRVTKIQARLTQKLTMPPF